MSAEKKLSKRQRAKLLSAELCDAVAALSDEGILALHDFTHDSMFTRCGSHIRREFAGKLAVLNSKGEVILEKENPGSEEMFLTYFNLGGSRMYFGFTDPQQEFTYFFDQDGKSVFPSPLENQGVPTMIAQKSGDVYFYCVSKNKITYYRPGLKGNRNLR